MKDNAIGFQIINWMWRRRADPRRRASPTRHAVGLREEDGVLRRIHDRLGGLVDDEAESPV
jgi:hypothetical protein